MDRINVFVGMLAIALVLGFAGIASAQEEETTEQVDWEEAAEWAELVGMFVNDDSVEMNTYYDDVQGVMWSQPADVSVEAATDALSMGAEYGMELDSFEWIVPKKLWLCDGEEEDCDEGTNYKWTSSEIELGETTTYVAYFWVTYKSTSYSSIERVYSTGGSSTNYCNGYFNGYIWDPSSNGWIDPVDDDWCVYSLGSGGYVVDDSSNIVNETYDGVNGEYVAKFRFRADSAYRYSVLSVPSSIE